MKKWYYLLFVVGLYLFSQTFQEFVLINGIISGIIAGIIIAFICKFVFSIVGRTLLFFAIIGVITAFLFSAGFIEIPNFIQELLGFREIVIGTLSNL